MQNAKLGSVDTAIWYGFIARMQYKILYNLPAWHTWDFASILVAHILNGLWKACIKIQEKHVHKEVDQNYWVT